MRGRVVMLASSTTLAGGWLWAPLLLTAVAACAVVFLRVERQAVSPLVRPQLFAVPALAHSITATGLTGVALFGTFTFIPLAIAAGTGLGSGRIGTLVWL
jgi:hypothetical protein